MDRDDNGDYITEIQIKEDVTPTLFNQIKSVFTQRLQIIYPIGLEANGFILGTNNNFYFDPNVSVRNHFHYFPASIDINIDMENNSIIFGVQGISTIYGDRASNLGDIRIDYYSSTDTIIINLL